AQARHVDLRPAGDVLDDVQGGGRPVDQIVVEGHVPHGLVGVAVADGEDGVAVLDRSEEHTSELQSPCNLVCRLLLEKKKPNAYPFKLAIIPTKITLIFRTAIARAKSSLALTSNSACDSVAPHLSCTTVIVTSSAYSH